MANKNSEKLTINKSKLAEKWGFDRGTIIRYVKKCVKDEKNPTEEELKKLDEEFLKLKDSKKTETLVNNAINGMKIEKKVDFSLDRSSTKERLAIMHEQYNFCLNLCKKNELKVNMVQDDDTIDENLKTMYQKNYRETAKTLTMLDGKVKELEKDLSLMNIEEDNPLED